MAHEGENRIRGYVLRSPGLAPVKGARVTVAGRGLRKEASTGHEGEWAVYVPRGGYSITVDANGLGSRTVDVLVVQDARFDFLLSREGMA